MMFGAHLPELLIVLVLALVVFGPKRLPEIGGALGKSIREFRDGTTDKPSITDSHVEPEVQTPRQPVAEPVQRNTVVNETASTGADAERV